MLFMKLDAARLYTCVHLLPTPNTTCKKAAAPAHVEKLDTTYGHAYSNFSPPVTRSTTLFGAGPTPSTVKLPGSICVRPASWITSAVTPRLCAWPINS